MRKIYAIGETLLDIIFRNGEPQTAKAGGSMLNSVVSLGRLGLPVSFISENGIDEVGKMIDIFLTGNGVDTSSVHRYKDANTSLALAFLNENNDANYSFYKNYPEKRLDIGFPEIHPEDIILFGSFYAISPEIRNQVVSFISNAGKKGAFIIYDPNFRKSHAEEIDSLRPLIIENMEMANLIRGSNEDFMNIFGATNPDEAWEIVKKHNKCMIYTYSSSGVFVRSHSFSGTFPVNRIVPVSTIGAGDNFNAGLISSLYRKKVLSEDLDSLKKSEWEEIIRTAIEFANHVCMSYDNYISKEFAAKFKLP
jgi:fructokinase